MSYLLNFIAPMNPPFRTRKTGFWGANYATHDELHLVNTNSTTYDTGCYLISYKYSDFLLLRQNPGCGLTVSPNWTMVLVFFSGGGRVPPPV